MIEMETGNFLLIKSIEKALEREVLLSPAMCNAQLLWGNLYRNKAPWRAEEVKSLHLASAIASELACQVTLDFKSNISGSKRAEMLNKEVYQKVIFDVRRLVEFACADGGIMFKPFLDANGLGVEYVRANQFFPLAVDSRGDLISAVFLEQLRKDGKIYTRLEEHVLDENGVTVRNLAFQNGGFWGLGKAIPLSEVAEWAELAECVTLAGAKKPLFSYFKMPIANIIDPDSPLGVSAYARSVDLIKEADMQFSRLIWEYEGGELAVDASVDALLMENGDMKLPNLSRRLFRALDIDAGGSDLYSVYAPELRDDSYIDGLNEILIRIEDLCGLARGTISNLNYKARTATELKLLRQRSYATVTDIQKSLQGTLADLVKSLDMMATAFGLLPAGVCDVIFEFDDSSVVDRNAQFLEMQQLIQQGVLSKWEFRTWYLGETETQARERIAEIEKEVVKTEETKV